MVKIVRGTSGQADLRTGVMNPLCYGGAFFGYENWIVKIGDTEIAKDVGMGYVGEPGWGVNSDGQVTVPATATLGNYEAIYSDLSAGCGPDAYEGTRYEFEVVEEVVVADEALTVIVDPTEFCPGDEISVLASYPLSGPAAAFYALTDTGFTTLLATSALTPNGSVGDLLAYVFNAPDVDAGSYMARFATSAAIYIPYANVGMTRVTGCPGDPPPPAENFKVVLHRWV